MSRRDAPVWGRGPKRQTWGRDETHLRWTEEPKSGYSAIMADIADRGATSNIRGWLSEVYIPALLSSDKEQLARRLGDRSTLDDPLFGRATGVPAVDQRLDEIAGWLSTNGGAFEKVAFLMGSDRDVTEGMLAITVERQRVNVPIAVVAERRPERAVELRVYYSTKGMRTQPAYRSPLLPRDDGVIVPPPVAMHLDALARGDLGAVVAGFEEAATVRAADGHEYAKLNGEGALRSYYENLCSAAVGPGGGTLLLKNARADDGRACALEYTVVRVRGQEVPPQAGFAVFERGESGLLRAVRVYGDVG